MAENTDLQEFKETIDSLEKMLGEIRHMIGYRRTILKNADKKLQQFQDTMYAMIMEEDSPRRKKFPGQKNDPGNIPF